MCSYISGEVHVRVWWRISSYGIPYSVDWVQKYKLAVLYLCLIHSLLGKSYS